MQQVSYIDDLLSLAGHGLRTSLGDVKKYLRSKGNPHEQLKVFHVGGTNGKGSVCQMLSQILYKQFDKQVGLFLSPHLIKVNERVQINGEMISDREFNQYVGMIYEETVDHYSFSFFVIIFLASVFYFIDKKVDFVVCEVGLGGKRDATNVREHPIATFITSIGYDHQRLLGPSLSQIQWNKMGIMKEDVICYTPVENDLMRRAAKLKHASLRIVKEEGVEYRSSGKYGTYKQFSDSIQTNLAGNHQESNARLVYHCLAELGFAPKKIREGLLFIEHHGRCQRLASNILLDGAHNSQGVEVLKRYVDTVRHRYLHIITVFGTCKTLEELVYFDDHLLHGDRNYCVQPTTHRGLDPQLYQSMLPFQVTNCAKDPSKALLQIIKHLKKDTLLVIYGSLYLAGEVLSEWQTGKG